MNQSAELNLLNEALAKAQGSFPIIVKKKTAKVKMKAGGEYSYKYADWADVLSAVTPKLSKNGLSLRQPIRHVDGRMRLVTELHHSSGQWTSDDGLPLTTGLPPQEFGSELTYMKRFGGCGMLGVAPDEEEDKALASNVKNRSGQLEAANARNERALQSESQLEVGTPLMITDEQKARVQKALKDNGKKAAELYEFLQAPIGTPIPASRLQDVLIWATTPRPPEMPKAVFDAFTVLDWTEFERNACMEKHEYDFPRILIYLNAMIDKENSKE